MDEELRLKGQQKRTAIIVLVESPIRHCATNSQARQEHAHDSADIANHLKLFERRYRADEHNPDEHFDFVELALADGLFIASILKFKVRKISPDTFLGKGQVQAIKQAVGSLKPDVVATNASLSPVHQRNLEEKWQVTVLTRDDIIFEIFEKNATTAEGKIQVELARLKHMLPRITGIGKQLSSPGGDVGTRGGPGEKLTQLTKDQIRRRIRNLERRIEKERKSRELRRKRRRKSGVFSVSLVGYTNAGKSSILGALTKCSVEIDDRYFTTLNPTTRTLYVGDGRKVVIKDTVGFLDDLPPELISAFRATLEELEHTDLFLLVVDSSRENVDFRIASSLNILKRFHLESVPLLIVFNKIDLVDDERYLRSLARRYPKSLFVSVRTGAGVRKIYEYLAEMASKVPVAHRL